MMNYGITNTFLFAYFTVFDHLYCKKGRCTCSVLISNWLLILETNISHRMPYICGYMGAKKSKGSSNFVVVILRFEPLTFCCSVLSPLNIKSLMMRIRSWTFVNEGFYFCKILTPLTRADSWKSFQNPWMLGIRFELRLHFLKQKKTIENEKKRRNNLEICFKLCIYVVYTHIKALII